MPLLLRMTRTPSMGSSKNTRRPSAVMGGFLSNMLDEVPPDGWQAARRLREGREERLPPWMHEIRLFKLQILTPKIMIFEINGPNELFTIGVFSARPRFGKYYYRLWVQKPSTASRGVTFWAFFPGLAVVYRILGPLNALKSALKRSVRLSKSLRFVH